MAQKRRRRWLLVACLGAGVLVPGCGSSGSSADSGGGSGCVTVNGGAVTVVSKSVSFSPACLKTTPGDLAVTYENEDTGVSHNFHLENATPKVADKDRTVIKPGSDTQTVVYKDLKVGSYKYVCDLHPNMTGVLQVEAATTSTVPAGS